MASYSALEAISPAIQRTKFYLFKPFQLGRFFKLALVAWLAEGASSGGNFNFSFPFPGKGDKPVPMDIPPLHWPSPSVWIAILAILILFFIPLGIVLSYLLIRLRFSFFECALDWHDRISVGWRKYHRQALRYLGASLCIGFAFLLIVALIGLAVWFRFRDLFAGLMAGNKTHLDIDFASVAVAVAVVFLVLFAAGIAAYVIQSMMGYFVLPRMALEDAPVLGALADAWGDMKAEPGQFALFMLMRILLPFAAGIIAVFVLIVPFIVLAAIAAGIGVAVHSMVQSNVVLIVLIAMAAVLAVALVLAFGITLGGTIGTFVRNYALLFYAGRYPELAMRLWPPPQPPQAFAGTDLQPPGS